MSSKIDGQAVNVQTLILPDVPGANNNTGAVQSPTRGSLCWDSSGGSVGAIYSGSGLQWTLLGGGGSTVIGPAVSTIGDLCSFANLTGNVIQDSSINQANVITSTSSNTSGHLPQFNGSRGVSDSGIVASNVVESTGGSSISGDLASFSGTGGRLIADSGISMISTSIPGIILTSSNSGTNLSALLNMQKINVGIISMVYFEIFIGVSITATTPSNWTSAVSTIPAAYLPSGPVNRTFPILVLDNNSGLFLQNAELIIGGTGYIEINVLDTVAAHSLNFNQYSGNYINAY